MATQATPNSASKRKRNSKKKKKSRTEVSSDSDSEVVQKKRRGQEKQDETMENGISTTPAKITRAQTEVATPTQSQAPPSPSVPSTAKSKSPPARQEESFSSIYLRKVTAELADDLDKVRKANDFSNRSLPMLIHALRQGESIFSGEEKKRVVGILNSA